MLRMFGDEKDVILARIRETVARMESQTQIKPSVSEKANIDEKKARKSLIDEFFDEDQDAVPDTEVIGIWAHQSFQKLKTEII